MSTNALRGFLMKVASNEGKVRCEGLRLIFNNVVPITKKEFKGRFSNYSIGLNKFLFLIFLGVDELQGNFCIFTGVNYL